MAAEFQQISNDPNAIVQIAIGEPIPILIPQLNSSDSNGRFQGVIGQEPKRYLIKKAHFSRDDVRVFDVQTKRLVFNSHHPGKNPYEMTDPLGVTNQDNHYKVHGGEWESICDVTAHGHGFQSFKIRPKMMSIHGRQFIKWNNDQVAFNVAKMSKLKTMSMREHYQISAGEDGDDHWLTCTADLMGRTYQFFNTRDELVAQMTKTNKAMLQTAAFGSGTESTIDIAPGMDCSLILAATYAIMQVGEHIVGDFLSNFVMDPLKDTVVDSAAEATGTSEILSSYERLSNKMHRITHKVSDTANFISNNFK